MLHALAEHLGALALATAVAAFVVAIVGAGYILRMRSRLRSRSVMVERLQLRICTPEGVALLGPIDAVSLAMVAKYGGAADGAWQDILAVQGWPAVEVRLEQG